MSNANLGLKYSEVQAISINSRCKEWGLNLNTTSAPHILNYFQLMAGNGRRIIAL
jgi:hypothetical protein